MSVDMTGRVVVVTGANAGIGRATARALAGMGAKVLACGRSRARLDEAITSIRADVADADVVPLVADLSSVSAVRGSPSRSRRRVNASMS